MPFEDFQNFFNKEYKWGKVQIGGAHCENPLVPIGSIFYMGQKTVTDPATGKFDEIAIADLVEKADKLAETLGISYILDVIGNTPEALCNYVTFLKKVTETPLLINASMPDVRIESLIRLTDMGVTDLGYNSIGGFSTDEEIESLSKLPVSVSVIQAYSKSKKHDAALKALIGDQRNASLLEKAYKAGIKNVMIDIPTLDLASIGLVPKMISSIRNVIDIPCGTAASNATYGSSVLKDRSIISKDQFRAVDASVNSYLETNGASFSLMGPLSGYEWVFPSVAFASAYHLYGLRSEGYTTHSDYHPIYKLI